MRTFASSRTLAVSVLAILLSLATAGCTSTGHAASGTTQDTKTSRKTTVGEPLVLNGPTGGDQIMADAVTVVDPDQPTDPSVTPSAGTRFVSIMFMIVNTDANSFRDDLMSAVTVEDTKGRSLRPVSVPHGTTAGGQLVSSVNLSPNDRVTGYITFDIPSTEKVANVKYAPGAGAYGAVGEWSVS